MKNTLLTLFSIITIGINAQNVGINTEEPTRTLDINGELRIRQVETGNFKGSFLIPAQGKDKNETHLVKQAGIDFKLVFEGVTTKTYQGGTNLTNGNHQLKNNSQLSFTANGNMQAKQIDTNYITFPYYRNYVGIKEPGIYFIVIGSTLNISSGQTDDFNGSFGNIDFKLLQQPLGTTIPYAELLGSSNIIFQGAGNSKGKGGAGATSYHLGDKGLFMFKGGTPLYLEFFAYGLHGIASSSESITLPEGKTSIKIYKIL